MDEWHHYAHAESQKGLALQDEFVVAFQVFNGLVAVAAKKKPSPPAPEAKAAETCLHIVSLIIGLLANQ